MAHESKWMAILVRHLEWARNGCEKQMLHYWFDVAWDYFIKNVVEAHLPMSMPKVLEMKVGLQVLHKAAPTRST